MLKKGDSTAASGGDNHCTGSGGGSALLAEMGCHVMGTESNVA